MGRVGTILVGRQEGCHFQRVGKAGVISNTGVCSIIFDGLWVGRLSMDCGQQVGEVGVLFNIWAISNGYIGQGLS